MRRSTQDLLFSFLPLGGWVASLSATPFWQSLGMLNLAFAILIISTALFERVDERKHAAKLHS